MTTFNKRITDSIQDGSIEEVEVDGVRCYRVKPPADGEEVVGYETSDCLYKQTLTEECEEKE